MPVANRVQTEVVITTRLLPLADADIEKLKAAVLEKIARLGGKAARCELEPVAFGMLALRLVFLFPEELGTEVIEKQLGALQGVSSVQILDVRRAV